MDALIKLVRDIIKAAVIAAGQHFLFLVARDVTSATDKGPLLVIAPHPDDETLGCGAAVARARDHGQEVHIVIVMDGESTPIPSSGSMIEIRRKEAERACSILGVGLEDIAFLNKPNRYAHDHVEAIESELRQQIEKINPALIISPYGDDKHSDHRAIAEAVANLFRKGVIKCPLYEYPIWFWMRSGVEHLLQPASWKQARKISTRGYLNDKKTAMRAHHSQYPSVFGGGAEGLFQPMSFLTQFFARYELFFEKDKA